MRIDDAITNYPKATLKSLSKPVAMAFNRLKQTVKKDMKDDAFASMIEEFRKNPIEEEEEEVENEESESDYSSESSENTSSTEESSSDSEESSDEESSDSESSNSESSDSEASDSEDSYENSSEESYSSSDSNSDSDSDSSSDSFASDSSSSSDSEMEVNPKLTGRAKWVLQPKDIEKAKRKEAERLKKLEEKKKKQEEKKEKEEEEKEEEEKVEDTYETPEKLVKALLQVLASRHRVTERKANVQQLQKLVPFARALGGKYELRVLSHLVCLQLAGVNSDTAIPAGQWSACLEDVRRMVGVAASGDG